MHAKIGLGVAAATMLAVAAVAPTASARPVAEHSASPSITQTYTCSTPIGTIALAGTVTGKANIKKGVIHLKKVVYSITNSVGLDLTVDHVQVSTADPDPTNAPYKNNSVKVAKKPKGWKAGHDATGVFALHPKSFTIPAGDNVTTPPLSAKYLVKGPKGTVINFQPGPFTFHVSAPVEGPVSCIPDAPVGTFATVTE